MRWQTIYEARWILVIAIIITLGLSLLSPWFLLLGGLLIGYIFYFFRDPERVTPGDERDVVSPADGVIADIVEIEESELLHQPTLRVGIFLSVFDVHTNRAPLAGTITYTKEANGKYLDARHPDASRLNAFRTWGLQTPQGELIVIRQITGAIARRIVAWAKPGDTLPKGGHFGMIRFGSRTEIYLPLNTTLKVEVGQRVKCGASIIARLPE